MIAKFRKMILELTALGTVYLSWLLFRPVPQASLFQDSSLMTEDDLYFFWLLSVKAYCAPENYSTMPFRNHVSAASFESSIYWAEWDISGYVATTTDSVTVVFRGTSDENWDLNMMSYKVKFDGCKFCRVHEGISLAVENTYDQVKAAVAQHTDKTIYVTGWSLGGTLATHTAAKLVEDGFNPTVISFGAYRVGNLFYARHYQT